MEKKRILIRLARIFAFSIVMCAVSVGLFYLYATEVPEILVKLEEKGNMKNTIEAVKHLVPMLNIAGLIIALTLIYKFVKAKDSDVQGEKGCIMLIVALFTYLIIWPYVIKVSEGCFDPLPEGEENVMSMLENTASWFATQILPFLIVTMYHFVRAGKKQEEAAREAIQHAKETEPADAEKTEEQNEEQV